ncbi:hypothetical protein G7054_g639 [Neopestalotiopsis clavispora]|nr:hypothetical protein G7054_g639 [Neopestalotiopsis clavispora]
MGHPSKTRLDSASIYSTATLVEEDNQWCGHPPCVSFSSELGCRQHNSAQSPMYRNTLLPPERPAERQDSKPRIVRLWDTIWRASQSKFALTGAPQAATIYSKPQSLFFSSLPFDPVSVNTIQPIHASVPHHLAFYHLHCIRRQLNPKVSIAFIPELSCNGTARFYEHGPEFAWSSEVYFDSGRFLQKQEISCVLEPGPDIEDIKFSECPHRFFKVVKLSSFEKNGWMEANCKLRYFPYYWLNRIDNRQWNSKDGRFTAMSMCSLCHSDHEKVMEVVGCQLHIRLTCYRDLGSGTDRNQDEWVALSTGEVNVPWRDTFDFKEVYGRVWRTAKRLGRPNLHVIIPKNSGEFDVSKMK